MDFFTYNLNNLVAIRNLQITGLISRKEIKAGKQMSDLNQKYCLEKKLMTRNKLSYKMNTNIHITPIALFGTVVVYTCTSVCTALFNYLASVEVALNFV